jgi:hypothetical protein
MKKASMTASLIFTWLFFTGTACMTLHAASWSGVDEAVIERIAEKAGRPAREPFINTDQGDLLLFVFLIAGATAGFAAGYYFRVLFPPKRKGDGKQDIPLTRTNHV